MLNPINHAWQPQRIERYKAEPYMMYADIYTASPHTGRGGRLGVAILPDLQLEVDHLYLAPCIRPNWRAT